MAKVLPSLLLLPPPPSPTTPDSLSVAYRPTIVDAISKLKELSTQTRLVVVLPVPSHLQLQGPRSHIYSSVQPLLAGLYGLICVVAAQLGADLESDTLESIDVSILLLDCNNTQSISEERPSFDPWVIGPIIDLQTLALTRRRWSIIFSVDGEQGQKLIAKYTTLANRVSPPLVGHVHSVSGGLSMVQQGSRLIRQPVASPSIHHVVALGGTFDHLHAGHKLLLTAATLLLQPTSSATPTHRRLIVGITGDELLKNKKYAEYMESWNQRQKDVVEFLLSILSFAASHQENTTQKLLFDEPGPNGRAIHTELTACSLTIECVEIQDPFGPTITDEEITALVVSGETRSGGQAVNDKRTEKGWNALEVFEVDVLDSEDTQGGHTKAEGFASKISSTAIRKRKAENDHPHSV